MRQFLLPDLGEGLGEAEIVAWHVTEGDHVVADQPLVSVETDKAVVEVPSPRSGRVARLFGAKGDLVKVGAPLVEFAEWPEADTGTVVGELDREEGKREAPRAPSEPVRARSLQVLPAVRALARKLDVDLNLVHASGPDSSAGQVTCHRAWGQSRKWGVWSAYNRQPLYLKAGDSTGAGSTTVIPSTPRTAHRQQPVGLLRAGRGAHRVSLRA